MADTAEGRLYGERLYAIINSDYLNDKNKLKELIKLQDSIDAQMRAFELDDIRVCLELTLPHYDPEYQISEENKNMLMEGMGDSDIYVDLLEVRNEATDTYTRILSNLGYSRNQDEDD